MTKRALCLGVLFVVLSVPAVLASPFQLPPETYAQPGEWIIPFPYQRNAMIDFGTNPSTWPSDPNNPSAYDLQPGIGGNYDLQGLYDYRPVGQQELHDSDWIYITPNYEWYAVDPILGSGRQGVLVWNNLYGNTPMDVVLRWHLDNMDWDNCVKDIWSELIWAQTGSGTVLNIGAEYPQGYTLSSLRLAAGPQPLPNNWLIAAGYAQIKPNPPWEEAILSVRVAPGEAFMIDSWHTATECIPEPGTCALMGVGLVALVAWRRRRNA